MVDPATAAQRWYVMLFPAPEEGRALLAALQPLAECSGGTLNTNLHVTVGYFRGASDPATVVERLRPLDGPIIAVHASGLFSFSEAPNPLFGWTLSVRVRREGGVQGWQRLVRDALEPLPLASVFSWEQQQPHLNIVQQLPTPPREALARLADRTDALTFTATRMVVSERNGDSFVNLLEQPLRGSSPAAQQAEQHAR